MKVIFAADIHLREHIWVRHPNIAGDSFIAFDQLCSYAAQLSIKEKTILILGGDIFDSAFPSGKCEKAFVDSIKKLQGRVQVLFIEGNHDKESVARPLLWGCTQLTEEPIIIEGISFVGINYTRNKEQLQETLANIAPCDFLILHSPFKHLLGFAGKWQLEFNDIPLHVGKVLVGDIHVKNITNNIYSPGSLAVNGVSEFTTDHGFFIIDTVDNSVDYVPIKTRNFTTLTWPIKHEDLAGISGDPVPVVQLIHTAKDTPEIDSFIESYPGIYFIKSIRTMGDTDFDVDSTAMLSKDDVLASSVENHLKDNPDALVLAIDLLLSKNNPEEILKKAYKEYINATGSH